MRLIPAPLEIAPDEGFQGQKDILGRADFGQRMTNLVQSIEHSAVLILDAPWGAGKTTFIRMWQGQLKENNIPSIYFDSFASDYMSDPFLAITGEIIDIAKKRIPDDKSKISSIINAAKSIGKVVLKHGSNAAIRAATFNIIDASALGSAGSDIEKVIAEKSGAATEEIIKECLERRDIERDIFETFRKSITELSDALRDEAGGGGPLIIIIDELDRCKPTFAMSLLESIKHFYEVPGIITILATNMSQLANSVRFAYGRDIDAYTYLEKFYHARLLLPQDGREAYLDKLLRMLPAHEKSDEIFMATLREAIIKISSRRNYSLRRLERIIACVTIFIASTKKKWKGVAPIVAGLCAVKFDRPDVYDKLKNGETPIEDIKSIVGFGDAIGNEDPTSKWWAYTLKSGMLASDINKFNEILAQSHIERDNFLSYLLSIIDGFDVPGAMLEGDQ